MGLPSETRLVKRAEDNRLQTLMGYTSVVIAMIYDNALQIRERGLENATGSRPQKRVSVRYGKPTKTFY